MTEIPVPPTVVAPGVTIASIAIECIVPHEYGALIQTKQGIGLQIASASAPEGWGDARIDKPGSAIMLSDIYAVIPTAVQHKYTKE